MEIRNERRERRIETSIIEDELLGLFRYILVFAENKGALKGIAGVEGCYASFNIADALIARFAELFNEICNRHYKEI